MPENTWRRTKTTDGTDMIEERINQHAVGYWRLVYLPAKVSKKRSQIVKGKHKSGKVRKHNGPGWFSAVVATKEWRTGVEFGDEW